MKSLLLKCKARGEKKKNRKKKDKSSWGGEKASQKVGTVRRVEEKPEVGSSNKKFLAPAAVSAGEFAGNVYRLTEEFRQGKGEKKKKGTNHTRALRHSPAVSKCKIKKKKEEAVSKL